MTSIFISTPAFSGEVHVQFALSLAETVVLLKREQIAFQMHLINTSTKLVEARNGIIRDFLQSGYTHLLMIDADLGWPPEAVLSFLEKDVDVIGGCYPSRNDKLFRYRPLTKEDGSIVINGSCLEMEAIPAGFLLLKRSVIEKTMGEEPLFRTGVKDDQFWGEDYYFCKTLRKSGFSILVDPSIPFNHDGFTGKLEDVLTFKRRSAS